MVVDRGAPPKRGRPSKGGPALRPTVVQFPTRPINDYTARGQREAKEATYTGRLREAADLYRSAVTEWGAAAGILSTISHGILGLPLALQGDPAQCAALLDAEGTPGDYGRMFPEDESAQVMADGIGFGVGLGQMLEPVDPMARPIGERHVPVMKWWDPRWLRQEPYSKQWKLMTRGGEVDINPGDGEWFLWSPYPKTDAWRHGPWLYMTIAFVFSRDAIFDRQRHSEVLAPTRVARATKPTTKDSRRDTFRKLQKMQRDNLLVLPEEYIYEIVDSTGRILDVYKAIVDWAMSEVEIGLTGNKIGVEGNKGFTSADVYQRVTDSKRRFYAQAWFRAVREQGLSWWALDNFGAPNAPTGGYNVESPEDAAARAESFGRWGDSLGKLKAGLDPLGVAADPAWILEVLQRAGIRAALKPAGTAPATKLEIAPTDVAKIVRVDEARALAKPQPASTARTA